MHDAEAHKSPHLHLTCIGERSSQTHCLPRQDEITLGRGKLCDVRIDDPSVASRHLILRLGPPMSIEDRGSETGTFVRDVRLPPNESKQIELGEMFVVGSVMVFVREAAVVQSSRRLLTHGYFEIRVEEECARAKRTGAEFCVLRVRCNPKPPTVDVARVLSEVFRPYDVTALYGPGEYEVLATDVSRGPAVELATRLAKCLNASGITAKIGVSSYPVDGRDACSIIANAIPGANLEARANEHEAQRSVPGVTSYMGQPLESIAATTISVVLMGETGVGKEVMADRIHRLSPRAQAPMVKINCGAFAPTLIENELFGHERGAFTGAEQTKEGLLEAAHGGTLFLDEVGELPLPAQVKLLRVIESREVVRLGSTTPRPVDVRFISATNRDLEDLVRRGEFRRDLFFRLNGFSLVVAPLRARRSEIPDLANIFIQDAWRKFGFKTRPPVLSDAALRVMQRYSWPGNIRELKTMLERAVVMAQGQAIEPLHLPLDKMLHPLENSRSRAGRSPLSQLRKLLRPSTAETDDHPKAPASPPKGSAPEAHRAEVRRAEARPAESRTPEEERILEALRETGGNQTRAAKLLGISRRTLLNRLDRYGIARPRKRVENSGKTSEP